MAGPATGLTPGPANPQPLNFGGIHTGPDFDLIELLPPAAADKVRALRQRSSDMHSLKVPFEEIREASAAKVDAENRLKQLQAHPQDHGHNLPDNHISVVQARRTLDKATDDLRRLNERSEQRAAAWQAASVALQAVEIWLRDGRPHGTALELVEVEPPKPAKGENGQLDQIENRRRRVRELRADLHRIQSAPFPSSHCKQRLREMVEQLAQRSAPDVGNLIEHDRDIIWPSQRVQSEVYAERRALAFHETVDVVGLIAFLMKPTLISALDALVDAEADDKAALTHEARQQREDEVMRDLLSVERDEAALVWRAIDEQLPVNHRADCSPLATLQIRLVTVPSAAPSGSSSYGYSWNIAGGGR